MRNFLRILTVYSLLLVHAPASAECNPQETGGGEILGTLVGAALGGLVGSQIGSGTGNKVAIGAGVLAGGFLGNRVGESLDCQDQQYHYDTTQSALETKPVGQSATWVNPDTGHSGEVMPTKTYTAADGSPCRNFTQTIYVDGNYEQIEGTACRQPDGTWKAVDS
jgi:surface antigen